MAVMVSEASNYVRRKAVCTSGKLIPQQRISEH